RLMFFRAVAHALRTHPFGSHACSPPRDLHSVPTRRSSDLGAMHGDVTAHAPSDLLERDRLAGADAHRLPRGGDRIAHPQFAVGRSEEHTSELQSRFDLVCRLLLEKKKRTRPKSATLLTIST